MTASIAQHHTESAAPMLAPALYQYMGAQLPFEAHGQTVETARQATARPAVRPSKKCSAEERILGLCN